MCVNYAKEFILMIFVALNIFNVNIIWIFENWIFFYKNFHKNAILSIKLKKKGKN